MAAPLSQRIADQVPDAATAYHRLILVTGLPRTGKTIALQELHADHGWPVININLSLSERLLELTTRQRSLKIAGILDKLAKETDADVVILERVSESGD